MPQHADATADAESENPPVVTVDGGQRTAAAAPEQTPGLRFNTLTLRPTIGQSVNSEERRFSGGVPRDRVYSTTTIGGMLTSDWSRHALTVTGEGAYERNFGRRGGEQPRAHVNADLQLDLGETTQAHLTGGYRFRREDTDDPNALSSAATQGGEHRFGAGGSLERDFGRLRGLAAVDLSRFAYTAATGADGRSIDLGDRDRTAAGLRGRLTYELSPALAPFFEVAGGRAVYDQRRDNTGYERSSYDWGVKTGAQIDLGEKLGGEAAIGYLNRRYDDDRLTPLAGLSFDGLMRWSPQRGTDIDFGLRTTLENFAGGGDSGWVSRRYYVSLSQQITHNITARLGGEIERRTFPASDLVASTEYTAGAGLIYRIGRYLDLTSDVSYRATPADDSGYFRFGTGLVLRR